MPYAIKTEFELSIKILAGFHIFLPHVAHHSNVETFSIQLYCMALCQHTFITPIPRQSYLVTRVATFFSPANFRPVLQTTKTVPCRYDLFRHHWSLGNVKSRSAYLSYLIDDNRDTYMYLDFNMWLYKRAQLFLTVIEGKIDLFFLIKIILNTNIMYVTMTINKYKIISERVLACVCFWD